MSLATAFYAAEQHYRRAVQSATWGHLEPKVGKHKGQVIFGVDRYGTIFYLKVRFRFPGGPCFHESVTDYFGSKAQHLQQEAIYKWQGYHRRCKNGKAKFGGKIRRVYLTD